MSVITIFSAACCHAQQVASKVAEQLGYRLTTDEELLSRASARFRVAEKKLRRAMYGPDLPFDRLMHKKERNISHVAHIRSCLAELAAQDNTVYHGLGAPLLPKSLTHVLKVGLVAALDYRAEIFAKTQNTDLKQAKAALKKKDEIPKKWTRYLLKARPWDKSLYDILIPMNDTAVDAAVALICENAAKPAVMETPASKQVMDDFLIACRVYEALAEMDHTVEVRCARGEVTLIVDEFVVRLERFKKRIEQIAVGVEGVRKASSRLGPNFRKPNIYPGVDLTPKILLVDDEKEFVCTLSERLETRDLKAAIAYDGEQALSIVASDAPDVMVLDLKMPGIDGIEVLRRVKRSHPQIEVIILTGHGSDRERALAGELGAFAYLQKPADIDTLAETMRRAYRKAERSKNR